METGNNLNWCVIPIIVAPFINKISRHFRNGHCTYISKIYILTDRCSICIRTIVIIFFCCCYNVSPFSGISLLIDRSARSSSSTDTRSASQRSFYLKMSVWPKECSLKTWQSVSKNSVADLLSLTKASTQTLFSNVSAIVKIAEPYQYNVRKHSIVD